MLRPDLHEVALEDTAYMTNDHADEMVGSFPKGMIEPQEVYNSVKARGHVNRDYQNSVDILAQKNSSRSIISSYS